MTPEQISQGEKWIKLKQKMRDLTTRLDVAEARVKELQQWAEEARGIIAALLEGGKIWTLGTTRDATKSPRWQEALAFLARPLPEEEPTPDATDLLHPTGRCTCYGEGTCEWCKWREQEPKS